MRNWPDIVPVTYGSCSHSGKIKCIHERHIHITALFLESAFLLIEKEENSSNDYD